MFYIDQNIFGSKVNLDGSTDWEKYLGGFAHDGGETITQTAAGTLLCVGRTNSSGEGGQDVLISELDLFGNLIAEATYGNQNDELIEATTKLGSSIYLAGHRSDASSSFSDSYLLRIPN